jgi:hypothetical protein
MAIKKALHTRHHWFKFVFFCAFAIINYVIGSKFGDILRCIHLIDNKLLITYKDAPTYDKIVKIKWLV